MIILGNTGGHAVHIEEYILMTISVAIGITGILVARKWYSEGWAIPQKISSSMKGLYQLLLGKYKLDEFYYAVLINPIVNISNKILWKFADVKIIDGIVNGSASVIFSAGQYIRRMQTGIAQNYAIVMMVGILIILTWLITTL
jgi:NADH-quinone oxidoreductase subunit L